MSTPLPPPPAYFAANAAAAGASMPTYSGPGVPARPGVPAAASGGLIRLGLPTAPRSQTLFVKNISLGIDEVVLQQYFEKHGKVVKVIIVRDPITQTSKGFGFVEMSDPDTAIRTHAATNMQTLDNKVLAIEIAKLPDAGVGLIAKTGAISAGGLPLVAPRPGTMAAAPKKEPKSRHQADGDGGFTAPRGFTDAATEQVGGITIYDDEWHTGNIPSAAAIAGTDQPAPPGPIMRDGKMVGWGRAWEEPRVGMVAPVQGTPESKCKAQKLAMAAFGPPPTHFRYDWSSLNFAGPTLPQPGFGGPPPQQSAGGFGGAPYPAQGGFGGGYPAGGYRPPGPPMGAYAAPQNAYARPF